MGLCLCTATRLISDELCLSGAKSGIPHLEKEWPMLWRAAAQVRHGTLALLAGSLSALEAVLQDCSAAAAAAAAETTGCLGSESAAPQQLPGAQRRRQGWLALRGWLQQAARQHLPDPTLLLALLAAAEKEGWERGELMAGLGWAGLVASSGGGQCRAEQGRLK